MRVDEKHEQWKAITEADFVTLFIKTWFTYIAVLRKLNPEVEVFTTDGLPRGDKPFLNAFKEGIMPIVQKQLSVDSVAKDLFNLYPIGMRKVIDEFPQYFFQTFFRINESFNYDDTSIQNDTDGKVKERFQANMHIEDRYCLKMYLGISGKFKTTNYNETIKRQIDLRSIIEATVAKHRRQNQTINAMQFMRDINDGILSEVAKKLRQYVDDILPTKGYNQTVKSKISGGCSRFLTGLRIKFEYNYKYPHEVGVLDDPNLYAIVFQIPFNGFDIIEPNNIFSTNEGYYSQLIATKGVEWFASYVYSLRNALFHEIISPLDEDWQTIFKSAYLVLKQITDICISYIIKIEDFVKTQENSVFDYAEKHQDIIFAPLADSVELLDFPKMSLKTWKIESGKIKLTGWFLTKLKLQTGTADDIAAGNGMIDEKELGFDYSVTLNDDFSIVVNNETGEEFIQIKLQTY